MLHRFLTSRFRLPYSSTTVVAVKSVNFLGSEKIGRESDSVLTTHVQVHVNAMLQSQQRPGIQEAEVGKIVRDVLGPARLQEEDER